MKICIVLISQWLPCTHNCEFFVLYGILVNILVNMRLFMRSPWLLHFRHSFDHVGSPSPTASSPTLMSQIEFSNLPPTDSTHLIKPQAEKLRRISTGSMDIAVVSETQPLHSSGSGFIKCMYLYIITMFNVSDLLKRKYAFCTWARPSKIRLSVLKQRI